MIILLLVALLVIMAGGVFIWFISTQRQLVNLDEKCNNALSQIQVQMNSRWDALLAVAKAATTYAKHESETLIKTIEGRRGMEMRSAADFNQQQSAFAEVLSKLMAVHEAYPDLKASALFKETMDNIKKFEDNVRMSRMIYNDSVRQWPSSFVASFLHFGLKDYLKIDDEKKRDMPGLFS